MARYTPSNKLNAKLLHLSFEDDLPKILTPKRPSVNEQIGVDPVYGEKDIPPRVCFSDTVQGCFSAIWLNLNYLFERKKQKYVDLYLYEGLPNANTKYVPKDVVLRNVWDATATNEVGVLNPIEVRKIALLRIKLTDEVIECHRFGDTSIPKEFVSPKITYTTLKHF